MARKTSPVPPPILEADHATVRAIQSLPDYHPANENYSLSRMIELQGRLFQVRQNRMHVEGTLDALRTEEAEISREYHDVVVGGRSSVVVQYGPDSTAVEQVGLTRKSNRKHPTRRQAAA
jgi:hypothetical protein